MGDVFEFVVDQGVYVRVGEYWRRGVVVEFSGETVRIRVGDHEEWFPMSEVRISDPEIANRRAFVTVYEVTRHYGGPEEGGWWWNRREAVCVIPLVEPGSEAEIAAVEEFLRPRFQPQGNIYSVRGGVDYIFVAEIEPREHEMLVSGGYQ